MKFSTNGLRLITVVLLCGLFFLFAVSVILLGSDLYRNMVDDTDERYTQRTALSYLVNQVRRGDVAGGVSVESFGGSDALVLRENGYITRLYCYNGQLYELYTEEGLEFAPEDGIAVLALTSLTLSVQDNCIFISADGFETAVSLRSAVSEVLS
ncbi:MAG: DUF4860 domain-containing protein [Oscillospiraceae bacterium]|nr:DUF4860 domain-containing protein [Oscillospiraceae bacterium]